MTLSKIVDVISGRARAESIDNGKVGLTSKSLSKTAAGKSIVSTSLAISDRTYSEEESIRASTSTIVVGVCRSNALSTGSSISAFRTS